MTYISTFFNNHERLFICETSYWIFQFETWLQWLSSFDMMHRTFLPGSCFKSNTPYRQCIFKTSALFVLGENIFFAIFDVWYNKKRNLAETFSAIKEKHTYLDEKCFRLLKDGKYFWSATATANTNTIQPLAH